MWIGGHLMYANLAVVRLLPLYLGVWVCLDVSQQGVVEGLWSADEKIPLQTEKS